MLAKDTRVLLVDDMKTMRKLVEAELRTMDYQNFTHCGSGKEAFDKIQEAATNLEPFHIIFCDWNMDNGTGIDLLRQVRQSPLFGKTPFVMITAKTEEADINEAFNSGVDAYIKKPFQQHSIPAIIGRLYAKGRLGSS